MYRNKCVICENSLDFLYSINCVPISMSPALNDTTISDDIIDNQIFHNCNKCGCVQLYNLVDPNILYKNSHNLTCNFPLWKQHHLMFSNFIINNINSDSILEIGGSSGALYTHIKDKLKYSCIDLCDNTFEDTDVVFIKGNCETYDFMGIKSVALSHVFEHLYNPMHFINNLFKCKVNEVFISIPNMNQQLIDKFPSILHYEHTYFIDKFFTEYMFSQYNFELVNYSKFKNHSIFMHFVRGVNKPLPLYYRDYISIEILNIHNESLNKFRNIKIKNNSFIVPGGYLGQKIYIECKPEKINGFLDNDISKQTKRVYGTPYYTYSFDKLKEYNKNDIYIYIYANQYTTEIINQLYNDYKIDSNNIYII